MPEAPLLGIFGGTFDPIHLGHTAMLVAIQKKIKFDHVLMLPCKTAPYPTIKIPSASAHQRIAMINLAIADLPWVSVDTRELERASDSYTVLTLESLHRDYPKHALCFIIGADAYATLPTWHQWQRLLMLTHFIVLPRAVADPTPVHDVDDLLKAHLISNPQLLQKQAYGSIYHCKCPLKAISSTTIRANCAKNQFHKTQLAKAVKAYIERHGLYHI